MLGHVLTLVGLTVTPQSPIQLDLHVSAGAVARDHTPVSAPLGAELRLPDSWHRSGTPLQATLTRASGNEIPAQIEHRDDEILVHWVQPELPRNDRESLTLTLAPKSEPSPPDETTWFRFESEDGGRELRLGDRPIWRTETRFDPDDRENTYKTFHHLFGMHDEGFLTKGPGGQFSHHRGLFVGWNKTQLGDRSVDFWHCGKADWVRHREFVTTHTGPVMAVSESVIDWIDAKGELIVEERRRLTAWHQPDGHHLIDVAITLTPASEPIRFRGDPQHAGCQIRLAERAATEEHPLQYVRPAGASTEGDDVWTDCAWVGCHFDLDGHKYMVAHLDRPTNPRPTVYSTRPYGRFGAYCVFDATPTQPQELYYRVLVADTSRHQHDQDDLARRHQSYSEPIGVEIHRR